MIHIKTPLRISFFGGGTDHPAWFNEHGGAVISTTIDKYIYLQMRKLPDTFAFNYRIVWRLLEQCKTVDEIQHPIIRETLKNSFPAIEKLEVIYSSDLPALSGLGSSSAFTVSFFKGMYELLGEDYSALTLANQAIALEQNILHESVGCQDQLIAAKGGFNTLRFMGRGTYFIQPLICSSTLKSHLMLFFTGLQRHANEIEREKLENFKDKKFELQTIQAMVDQAENLLDNPYDFGKLLSESWKLKRSLSPNVSNAFIDSLYDKAIAAGAIGGKLLGAGGGGFLLFVVPPERQYAIKQALPLPEIPFNFDPQGSRVVYRD